MKVQLTRIFFAVFFTQRDQSCLDWCFCICSCNFEHDCSEMARKFNYVAIVLVSFTGYMKTTCRWPITTIWKNVCFSE